MFNKLLTIKQTAIDTKRSNFVLGILLSGAGLMFLGIIEAVLPTEDDVEKDDIPEITE